MEIPQKLHLIGIGGAGMGPLAAILLELGCRVSGSDQTANEKITELREKGAAIGLGHRGELLPADTGLVVYSAAVPADNPERLRAVELGIPQLRRGDFLADLGKQYRRLVAVSGSHGKTSVTAMLVHILKQAGLAPGYLIGGSVPGLPAGAAGDGDIFVTEADESDGSHTFLFPSLGLVPNADGDHAWSVGGEAALRENFQRFARQSAELLYYRDAVPADYFHDHPNARGLTFAEAELAELDPLIGFQRRNAFLAVTAAERLGVEHRAALRTIRSFPGVRRRMTLHFDSPELTIIEDYAHHPVELANSIEYLRARYPDRHLRIVFQPHRHARLQKYLPELAQGLRQADSVLVTPVFAAWTESGPVSGADLAAAAGPAAVYLAADWPEIAAAALDYPGIRPLLLAVIGAGDLDKIFLHLPPAKR